MKVLSVIRRVLERGCGVRLRDVLRSSEYQRCAATRVALAAPLNLDSDEAIAAKIGHLEMGRRLYCSFERRAFQRLAREEPMLLPRTHPRFTALLEMTGRAIVKAAGDRLPANLKLLAVEYRSASAKRQLRILTTVVREIRTLSVTHGTVLEDLLSQTEERVLPFCYGGGDAMPNCVGKAQLSAAFCELAGIRAYAVTPILSSTRAFNLFHGRVANVTCDVFRDRGIWIGDPLDGFVQRSFHGHELTLAALDWPHLGLVVQLRNGRWAAFDAAGDLAKLFSKRWEIEDSVAICDKYADALPGLSSLCVSQNYGWAQKHSLPHFVAGGTAATAVWEQLQPLVEAGRPTDTELFYDVPACYERSGVLSHFRFGSRIKSSTRRFTEYADLCGAGRALMFDQARVDPFQFADAFVNGDTAFVEEALEKVRRSYWQAPSYLMTVHLDHLFRNFSRAIAHEPYAACELARLNYTIAVATVAHVGYFMGMEEETEAALSQESFGQFRLLYAATAPKRRDEGNGNLREELSREIFQKLPVRLLTGNRAFGIKQWELPVKGGEADVTQSHDGTAQAGQ